MGQIPFPTSQPSIDVSMNNNYQTGNIHRSNNTKLGMTIADVFVCKNFPDTGVESQRFHRVINLAILMGLDFKYPVSAKILGPLFTISYDDKHQ